MPTHPPALLPSYPQTLLSPHGRLLDLRQPRVMGILNVTPDSFFTGSRVGGEADLLARAGALLTAGATVLDVGAYSTRPGAADVPVAEELARLLPALGPCGANSPKCFCRSIRSGRPWPRPPCTPGPTW
ncbi:dihydropteroate synthase [Hymenobacter coccineus]|uniref:dihydropteroate synthase n=1 Tax=Hymenobacter coccineus TaxID=1908235 RepID=UPI000B236B97|nr:dihydropteroate synthase [Hymenobacter coccineus]